VNRANDQGETALMLAAGVGHAAAVRRLLDAGADAAAEDGAGKTAAGYAKTDDVRLLLPA
jgi:ankyrin repeat protein